MPPKTRYDNFLSAPQPHNPAQESAAERSFDGIFISFEIIAERPPQVKPEMMPNWDSPLEIGDSPFGIDKNGANSAVF